MSDDVIIRRSGPGYMVAEPYLRERDGEPAIATRHRRFYRTATAAVSAALDRVKDDDGTETAETPQASSAQGRQPNPDRLKPQARQVLHHLILRRGLTARSAMEMTPPCYRLAARIAEIRAEFGYEAVETQSAPHPGGSHALYRWVGPDSVQLSLSEEAA